MVPAVRNAKSVLSSGHAGVPKVLLMLTDGRPSDRPASEFQSAKAAGIKVMMVLVGKNIRRSTGCQYPASSVAHRRTLLPCFLDSEYTTEYWKELSVKVCRGEEEEEERDVRV